MKTLLIIFILIFQGLLKSQTDYLSETKNALNLYNKSVKQKQPALLPLNWAGNKSMLSPKKDHNEVLKCRKYIEGLLSGNRMDSIKNKLKECLPAFSTDNNQFRYAIRQVDVEYRRPGSFDEGYQLYYFARKNDDDFFGIYFQSDAFLYHSIDTILDDMFKIQSGYENNIYTGEDTRLSYFTGIYFFDLSPDGYHLQLNLCSPENLLSDRKVFRTQCCNGKTVNICDLTPDNNIMAYKTHEYRKYNPDRIYATNPYSLYFSNRKQLDDWARLCKGITSPFNKSESPDQCICSGSMKYRAVFGDVYNRFESSRENEKVFTLFFDRNGDLYPPFARAGSCKDICEYSASVRTYYEQNNNNDFDVFETQQINLVNSKINAALALQNSPRLVVMSLGFDNTYGDASPKLDSLIEKVSKSDPNHQHVFVKIIWDGTQTEGLTGLNKKIAIANNFRYANGTSYEVGDKLRKILRSVENKTIYFISHSLGANIICESLFNQISKVPARLRQESMDFYHNNNTSGSGFSIPQNKNLRVALIAPAIPGRTTFKDLLEVDTSINKLTLTNRYNFFIGQNTMDSTLSKKFIKNLDLGGKMSSTTLGYDENEADRVIKDFEKNKREQLSLKVYNFSREKPLYKHDVLLYLNSTVYDEILKELFKE